MLDALNPARNNPSVAHSNEKLVGEPEAILVRVLVDVKKLGAIRPGGGWRAHGRESAEHRASIRETTAGRRVGYDYVHCAIDDHTRLAYGEIHPDEKADTCAEFLRRAAI